MPFYQMLCIAAHYDKYTHIKSLVRQSIMHVLDNGGVVRKINSWGTQTLPQRMRKGENYHQIGDYWTMQFDASPKTLRGLNSLLRKDPRVIQWTTLKQGEKLEDVVRPRERTRIEVHSTPDSRKASAPARPV